jgi:phosphoglucosamine mutase
MTLRFGTDGIRGVANLELGPELALDVGLAAARVLGDRRWMIGRDTRRSGSMLAAALAAGLASRGAEVIDLGVLPTPAVAHLSAAETTPAAVISASHNPFGDNGIKLFAAGGRKLSDALEAELEAGLGHGSEGADRLRPSGRAVGTVRTDPGAWRRYADHLQALVRTGPSLSGLRVAVDAANGAASGVAPHVLRAVGADLVVINAEPDGANINAGCGSTHPEALQRLVVERGVDVGLAFDGDADRVLAVDARGDLVDGDQIIAVCALDLHERRRLAKDTVVVTVMANLGFRLAMREHDISVLETKVGDRHVLEALERDGLTLGGEQSGHVIFRQLATTGDGLLTGLQLLGVMARTGRPLADLATVMKRMPQVLHNVAVADRGQDVLDGIGEAVADAEATLGDQGRVLVRPSGTEPVVRVMVEAPTTEAAEAVAARLAEAVERAGR